MKQLLVLITILAIAEFAVGQGGWQMIWNDEFDGNTLDTSKWDIEVNCWGGGNNEKQCYTSRKENIYVKDGVLNIVPVKGTYTGTWDDCTLNTDNTCGNTMPATSGRVRTLKSPTGSWKYGRFVTRAQLPKGNFLWPAIWMMPTDSVYGSWAASGEIDIMEFRGQEPRTVLHTLHYGGGWPNNRHGGGSKTYNFELANDFHDFILEWDENAMKFYVDDTMAYEVSMKQSFGSMYSKQGQPFDQKFHMILNCAIDGNFFGGNYGRFDIERDAQTWTQHFKIDYVRVYQWSNTPIPPPVSPQPVAPPVSPQPVQPPEPLEPLEPLPGTETRTSSNIFTAAPNAPNVIFMDADTTIDIRFSELVFGNDATLRARIDPNSEEPTSLVYLKFGLDPDATSNMTNAQLFLYVAKVSESAEVELSETTSSQWTQTDMTWGGKVDSTGTVVASDTVVNTGWLKLNITDLLAVSVATSSSAKAERTTLSLLLQPKSGAIEFLSRESPFKQPRVVITKQENA